MYVDTSTVCIEGDFFQGGKTVILLEGSIIFPISEITPDADVFLLSAWSVY